MKPPVSVGNDWQRLSDGGSSSRECGSVRVPKRQRRPLYVIPPNEVSPGIGERIRGHEARALWEEDLVVQARRLTPKGRLVVAIRSLDVRAPYDVVDGMA